MRTVQQIALIFVALGVGLGLGLWFLFPETLERPAAKRATSAREQRVLLFFTEDHCIWCDRMKREMKKPAVRSAMDRYEVREIHDSNLARQYRVSGYPTLVITDSAGNELARQKGYRDAAGFTAWLSR